MSETFNKFIAQRLYKSFTNGSLQILPGERFFLSLDQETTVKGVYEALEAIAKSNGDFQSFTFGAYETYSIGLSSTRLVVAAKYNYELTDDFLTTLRNANLGGEHYPILILAVSTIDSISSGTRNLSNPGMPFSQEAIRTYINEEIESYKENPLEEAVLKKSLAALEADRYTDQSSLKEYEPLLTVFENGAIRKENYPSLGFFPFSNHVEKRNVKSEVNDNAAYFEQLYRIYGRNDFNEVKDKFGRDVKQKMEKNRDEDLPWYDELTYEMVRQGYQDAQEKADKKEEILMNTIWFSSTDGEELPLGHFLNSIRNKNYDLIIFNPDSLHELVLHFEVTKKPQSWEVKPVESAQPTVEKKKVSWTLQAEGCSFYSIKPKGVKTGELKICILNIPKSFLPMKEQSYALKVAKSLKSSKIETSIGQDMFVLNESGPVIKETDFDEDPQDIQMTIAQKLQVNFDEASLMEHYKDLIVNIGTIRIPFKIKGETQKIRELDGKGVLFRKLTEKKSFIYSGTNFLMGVEKFRAKSGTHFKESLRLEKEFLDQRLVIAQFNDRLQSSLEKSSLEDELDPELKTAFLKVLDCFEQEQTLPSLAYYSNTLLGAVHGFLDRFISALQEIQDQNSLKLKESAMLFMGAVLDPNNSQLQFTPFSPLNLMYQVKLQKYTCGDLEMRFVEMLSAQNLLPYLKAPLPTPDSSESYAIAEQDHSPEWRYYSQRGVTESLVSRSYVKTIVKNKITQYQSHFPFLFEAPSSLTMNINVIYMGNCEEVFDGIIEYYVDQLRSGMDPDKYICFNISIYKTNLLDETVFDRLMDSEKLHRYLEEHISERKVELSELASILSRKLKIFNFSYNDARKINFNYAHLSFIEMKSNPTTGTQNMFTMPTGMAIDGLISGISSAMKTDNAWYTSGFGMEYAPLTDFTKTIATLNAASSVAFTGSDYSKNVCLNTQINAKQDILLKNLYEASNWVVFINPKVDLSFFSNPGVADDLMIIHYSDQLSPASGYDDITVTSKVQQYEARIREYLENAGISSSRSKIGSIIQLFNAVNGDWLLRMNAGNFSENKSYFGKEKMSILAGVRLMLLYSSVCTAGQNTIWVLMSLEEILRVSGNVGLSQKDGRLSARNLGFEEGPTCDDLLLVGIRSNGDEEPLQVVFHPVEVKIGHNESGVMTKAKSQIRNALHGLTNAIFPKESDTLAARLLQTFFLQQVLLAAEKIKAFSIYPNTNWDLLIKDWRMKLLNNDVIYSSLLNHTMAQGTVISFKNDAIKGYLNPVQEEDVNINVLTLPAKSGAAYLTEDFEEIYQQLYSWDLLPSTDDEGSFCDVEFSSQDENENEQDTAEKSTIGEKVIDPDSLPPQKPFNSHVTVLKSDDKNDLSEEKTKDKDNDQVVRTAQKYSESTVVSNEQVKTDEQYMEIRFGTNDSSNKLVWWQPNNSEVVVNLNTGVIGTSGTGKTQFVKSLIAQLVMQKKRNFDNEDFGILIFDYKGDYNRTKKDFYDLLQPTILKLEDLPVNPFTLEGAKPGQTRIPIHRARGFVDTISRAYKLGKVQQSNLKNAIMDAYTLKGIDKRDSSTWTNLPPTLKDVYDVYLENDDIKKGDSLEAALEELDDFGIFESDPSKAKTLYDLIKGVVVVDLTTSDSTSIRNLVVAVMLDLFYQQMLARGSSKIRGHYRELTKFILVDEADNFMSQNFESLKKILKEGREFGVGMILSTQYLNHFDYGDDNYAKYINTWIIHEFKGGKPAEMDLIFGNAKPEVRQQKLEQISGLQKFHSIVKIGTGLPQMIRDYSFYLLLEQLASEKREG